MPITTSEIFAQSGASLLGTLGAGNAQTIAIDKSGNPDDVTTAANYNYILYGPVSNSNGGSLTIAAGSNIKIIDIADV